MFANFLFMIAPFRVESLNNKWSGMEPSVSRTFRYLEPNLVSIEFASLRLYLERAVLDTPDNSNQFWLPWYKLTPDNSKQREFPKHLVRMSITFSPLRWLYIPFYDICINNVFRWQMLANVGKSHSTRLKVNNILQCQTTYRRLFQNLNVVPVATTERDGWLVLWIYLTSRRCLMNLLCFRGNRVNIQAVPTDKAARKSVHEFEAIRKFRFECVLH